MLGQHSPVYFHCLATGRNHHLGLAGKTRIALNHNKPFKTFFYNYVNENYIRETSTVRGESQKVDSRTFGLPLWKDLIKNTRLYKYP